MQLISGGGDKLTIAHGLHAAYRETENPLACMHVNSVQTCKSIKLIMIDAAALEISHLWYTLF